MRIFALGIMAASSHVAVVRRDFVPSQMCSSPGVHKSLGALILLTADVVALWVASGDEYSGTLEDLNVGEVYALPWITRCGAARAHLTGATPTMRMGWKLTQSKPRCLLVVTPQFMSGHMSLVQCRHVENHCPLCLVLCPIQFDQIYGRSYTHRYYHRSQELSLFVVVSQVRYTPWSLMYSL